jgi:hypothetical protein
MDEQPTQQPHPLSIAITVRDYFTDAMIGQYRYERRGQSEQKIIAADCSKHVDTQLDP